MLQQRRFRTVTLPAGVAPISRSDGGFPSLLSGQLHLDHTAAGRAVAAARAATTHDGILRVVREAVVDDPYGELHTVVMQPGTLPASVSGDTLFYYAVPSPLPRLPLRQQPPPTALPPAPPALLLPVGPQSGVFPPRDRERGLTPAAELSAVGRVERWADRMLDDVPGQGSSIMMGVGAPKVGKSTFMDLVPAIVQLRRASHGAPAAVFFQHTFTEGVAPAACMVGLLEGLHEFQISFGLADRGTTLAAGHATRPFSAFQTLVPTIAGRLAAAGHGPFIVAIDECSAPLLPPLRGAGDVERTAFRADRTAYLAALKSVVEACEGAHIVAVGSGMVGFLNALVSQGSHGFHMLGDAHIVRLGDSMPLTLARCVAEDLAHLAGFNDSELPDRVVAALSHPFLSLRTALIADIVRRYEGVTPLERRLDDSVAACVSKMESDMRSDVLAALDDAPTTAMEVLQTSPLTRTG